MGCGGAGCEASYNYPNDSGFDSDLHDRMIHDKGPLPGSAHWTWQSCTAIQAQIYKRLVSSLHSVGLYAEGSSGTTCSRVNLGHDFCPSFATPLH
jgi:hypothetical protein